VNIYADNNGKITMGAIIKQNHVYLRVIIDLYTKQTFLQYSTDGKVFTRLGDGCSLSDYNYWKAVRPGLFSYNTVQDLGDAKFDWFHYEYDGPNGGL
jgi:hypothetical protein